MLGNKSNFVIQYGACYINKHKPHDFSIDLACCKLLTHFYRSPLLEAPFIDLACSSLNSIHQAYCKMLKFLNVYNIQFEKNSLEIFPFHNTSWLIDYMSSERSNSTMAEVCDQSEVSQPDVYQGWELQQQQSGHDPDSFTKRVLRGSLHLLPQSAICVPTCFVQAHLETFQAGNLITLEGPSGNTWKVRATGKPILQSGWRAFAHDNGLREGDELKFTITQPSYFVVGICNRRGVVKSLTAVNTGKYSATRPSRCGPRKRSSYQEENTSEAVATIASRCKTTVRERGGHMLRFSQKRRHWSCREDNSSGREVVTIFDDSDVDQFELSFGSAKVQSYRMSKTQRMMGYMKTQSELIPPPPVRVTVVTTHTQTCHAVDLNELIPDQDQDMMILESEGPLPQCQITLEPKHANEETMMSENVKARHLLQSGPYESALQIQTIQARPEEVVQIPSVLADEHVEPELANGTETPTDGLFETLQNIVDMPVMTDTARIEPVPGRRVVSVKRDLGGQSSTTACVLKSKRMPVPMMYRAKTVRAAEAMTKKLRSPYFVAVMKESNVYSGFSMDVPAEFMKRARLPVAEARVLLVCDEVPTMTRAIWMGTNPDKPNLDARAWMEFSRSHFLEEGDVCVFELFNHAPTHIGIHIFRAANLRRVRLPIAWTQHYHVVHNLDSEPQPGCSTSDSATTALTLL